MSRFTRILSTIPLLAAAPFAGADAVVNDDQIVVFSQCVGQDCVSGESFGFDTQRLKENNLRIHFQDTSNSASFPTTDWRIVINDSNNGGDSYFAVEDADAANSILVLRASAPPNSLYVAESGNVGVGTDDPGNDLTVSSTNSPTIQLQQSGDGGFTAAVWEITANEAGLTISLDGTDLLALSNNGDLKIEGDLTAGAAEETFPDYVFAPEYTLMPLAELRSYVAKERHLPGVPSAREVGAQGLNMTQLQITLLEKLEELTLYTLQQQAEIDSLRAQLQSQQ